MSYDETVRAKLRSLTERSSERTELWQKVVTANEQGGVEQVKVMLADELQSLQHEFEEAIRKFEKML